MQERKTNRNHNAHGGGGGGVGGAAATPGSHSVADAHSTSNMVLRFEEEVKASIFNVMYILLKDSDISALKFSIILIIDFLQVLQFTFDDSMESAWKSESVFYYISTFLNFTHIVPWMDGLDLVSYLVIFYLCAFLVTCSIIAFIYVSYSYTRLKTAFIWPQQLLRQGCFIIPTVLFIPFLELFTSMLVCVEKDEKITQVLTKTKSVHLIYQDFQCWTGLHIIHSTFAIAASLALIGFSMLVTLTFYKSLQSHTDASAKSDSRADVQRLIQRIILTFAFSFLYEEKSQWFLIAISVILAGITLERFFSLRSYYNEDIQKLQCILRGVGLWSTLILFLSKLFQGTDFNGGIQLWILGLPLMIAIVFFSRDTRKQMMMINPSTFQQDDEIARQIRYFLHVLSLRDNGDRNAEIILKGYIYSHEETCPNSQCQLKQYKRNIILFTKNKAAKGRGGSSLMQSHMLMSQKLDNNLLLLQHAKNMFRLGIQKFPTSSSLHIQYAFFLFEKMSKRQEALHELNLAQLLQPTFDEQFIIFRHKMLSEEYSEESQQMVSANAQANQGQMGQADKNNQQAQNAVDIMTRFAFESTFRQLQMQIEKCAHFHVEFWNYLRDDRPDLGKLGDCGTRINSSIMNVEQIWIELQKLNQNVPKAMKLYGRFLLEILNDKEQGQEYLQRAKDVANMKQNYMISTFEEVSNILQISTDGTPCIIVSGEPEKISFITQCNQGAVRVFGYQQYELKNQKVEKLMPEIYSRHHSKILDEALQKGPENIVNKERLIFAKHKSGYIFPVWIQLKLIQNIQNEIQFIALFKIDKKMMNANTGFILFNKEKKLQGISSSCIKMMGLDIQMMRRMLATNYDLSKLSPDLEDQREELSQSKTGLVLEWVIPFFSRKKWPIKLQGFERITTQKKKELEEKDRLGVSHNMVGHQKNLAQQANNKRDNNTTVTKRRFKFLCTLTTINMGNIQEIGHYIKLELAKNDSARHFHQSQQVQSQIPKIQGQHTRAGKDQVKQPLFQFRFDFYTARFIREIREPHHPYSNKNPFFTDDELLKQSTDDSYKKSGNGHKSLHDASDPIFVGINDKVNDNKKSGKEELESRKDPTSEATALQLAGIGGAFIGEMMQEDLYLKKKKWGKGIQIYTLREGRVQLKDYVDEEKRLIELEEMKRRKLEEEERNKQELANFTNNIKSKKALRVALNDQRVPNAIKNLRFTMNAVMVCLLAFAIAEFTVISQQFQEINENFGMIQRSYLRVSEVQRVAYDIRSIILINEGRLSTYRDYTLSSVDFIDYLKQDLELALNSLYDLQDYISLSRLTLSSLHRQMVEQKIVPLQFKESVSGSKVINFTLTESILQMSSAIFTVRHLESSKYNESQEDIYFVMYNSFNGFLLSMLQSSDYYEQELYDRSSQKNNLLLILFLASLGTVCLSMPILFPAVNSVSKTKEKVLTLFIEIPNGYLTELSNRCDSFLNSFYDDQQDESKSQDEGSTHGGMDFSGTTDSGVTKRNVIKQPRNTQKTSRNFFLQFFFTVVVVIAYFTSMFIIAKNYINNIEIVTKEMSIASFNEAHLSFLLNSQREMIYNPNKQIFLRDSFTVSKEYLQTIYDRVQVYLDLHQENRNVLDADYRDIFDSIMNGNLCTSSHINFNLIPQDCTSLFSQGATHGLKSVIIMYFELLRETLNTQKNLMIAAANATSKSNSTTVVTPTTKITQTSGKKRVLQGITIPKGGITGTTTNTTKTNSTTTNNTANTTKTNATNTTTNTTKTNTTTPPSTPTPAPTPVPTPTSTKTNTTNATTNTTANSTTTAQASFLNSNQFKVLYWMQYRFLQDAFRTLVNTLNSSTNTEFETTINTKMAVFIVFVILTCLTYLVFWTPFLSKLNRDIQRTKLMLTIIPIPIIMKVPKIQEFLNKQAASSGATSAGGALVSSGGASTLDGEGDGGKDQKGSRKGHKQ